MKFFLILISLIAYVYSTAIDGVVVDFVLNNIDCGCNRSTDLEVPKVNLTMYNHRTGAVAVYPIDEYKSMIARDDWIVNRTCVTMFILGFRNGEKSDVECSIEKIKCNAYNPISIIPDPSAYTDGTFIETLNLVNLYKKAVKYTKSIGYRLADVVKEMMSKVNIDQIHILGHSLGAHMAGYVGEAFYSETGQKLSYIYGLDPAGPCFTECPNESFRASQANVTVAFHCNSGEYGTSLRLGDIDLVSDDGETQKECKNNFISAYSRFRCSHLKCVPITLNPYIYRNASIWQAKKCSSYEEYQSGACDNNTIIRAGYGLETNERGTFYFTHTNNLTCDTVFATVSNNNSNYDTDADENDSAQT